MFLKQNGKNKNNSVNDARVYINELYAQYNKSAGEIFIDGVKAGAAAVGGAVIKGIGSIGSVIGKLA